MAVRAVLPAAAVVVVLAACTVSVDGSGRPDAAGTVAPTTTRAPMSPLPPPTVPPGPKVTPAPRNPLAVPAHFGGTWRGTVEQPGSSIPRWIAVVTISAGAVQGSFTIEDHCSGFADVVAVSGTKLVLLEEITSDPSGTCADRGVVELVPAGKNRLRMRWVDSGQDTNVATGILTRS
jgi:hypothetical protein